VTLQVKWFGIKLRTIHAPFKPLLLQDPHGYCVKHFSSPSNMPLPRHRQLLGGVFLLALDHAVQLLRAAQVLRGPSDASRFVYCDCRLFRISFINY
jgi:hypothetical protein